MLHIEHQNKIPLLVQEKVAMEAWAKSSCKYCYGRGYVGILKGTNEKVTCSCVAKAIQKAAAAVKDQKPPAKIVAEDIKSEETKTKE